MKKHLFIAGNWKSNKNTIEAHAWLQSFKSQISNLNDRWEHSSVVLCAPFTLLGLLHDQIAQLQLPIQLGAQDVSPYPSGAYTGEVNARQLKELVDWVIIGHSERRRYLHETNVVLAQKVEQAKSEGLRIIYCVPDEKTTIPDGVDVVAYEPVRAIGTGKSDSPENANNVVATIKKKTKSQIVIYGGSVTGENIASYLLQPSVDGVLPGGASLDPEIFCGLIQKVLTVC